MKILFALLLALIPPAAQAAPPMLQDLSIEELAGQLFMIAVDTSIAVDREADIRAGRLGGGLLRWDRFTGAEAAAFTAKMREWSADSPHKIPFWVSTDHEGGPTFTQRKYGVTPFPGNMALGAAGSEALVKDMARSTALELRALGIHVTFAPVIDVNSNPLNPIVGLRSFGEDPALVARLGNAALAGYREGGLLAVVKHFPGHGDTSEDSHLGLPVSTKTLAELDAVELVPFRAAFAAGAAAVMPAHMVFPALGTDPVTPVTLSSAATSGFLRGRMAFNGLIFSDSLDMGAIANVHGSSQAAIGALEAGVDVLLLGKADFPSAFAALVDAVKNGRVSRARLERSVARGLKAKRRFELFERKAPRPLSAELLEKHRRLARRAAEAAVTLVRNDGTIPLRLKDGDRRGLVMIHAPRYAEESALFAAEITKRHPLVDIVDVPAMYPSTTTIEAALAKVAGASAVILGTYQYGTPTAPNAALLIRRLVDSSSPIVAVSMMNPYDLSLSTGANAAVCAYGMTASSLEAAARLIFGEIPAHGRLPVTLPGVAARGAGLIKKPSGGRTQ